jgi:hypothetical protein
MHEHKNLVFKDHGYYAMPTGEKEWFIFQVLAKTPSLRKYVQRVCHVGEDVFSLALSVEGVFFQWSSWQLLNAKHSLFCHVKFDF